MKTLSKLLLSAPILLLAFLLTACSESSNNATSATLSGTAAKGAAIKGFVYAKDAKGIEVNVATGIEGSFTLNAANLTPPIMLKIMPDDTSISPYFSYAATNSQTVNITPLTHLALFLAAGKSNPDTLYNAWKGDNITKTSLTNAQAVLNANLRQQMTDNNLDANRYNFFTSPFSANSTGIDKVLDNITISIDATTNAINFSIPSQAGFNFNEAISVAGIDIESNASESMGANETPASIPAEHAKQYTLTYKATKAGSGIVDDTQRTFALGTDGTLVIDGTTTLTNPVLYNNNPYEAIWSDATNNLKYAFSSIKAGDSFNEINVSNNLHYDQAGFIFYGQFKDRTANTATCQQTNGSLTLSGNTSAVTDLTGTEFCPGKTFEVTDATGLLSFTDTMSTDTRKGGVISLQVATGKNIFTTETGFVQITYTQNGVNHQKDATDVTLATYGVTIDQTTKTVTFVNVTLPAQKCGQCKGVGTLTLNGALKYN